MKKLYLVLFMSMHSFACTDLLNTDIRQLDSAKITNLCEFEDEVILVVNVASRCGFTYQYEGLQSLYNNYKDQGFVVIGIPSRDFLFQEYKEEGDVAEFCSTEYGVEFPMFATSKVTGKNAHPFYKKLKAQSGVSPSWNFNKFLISRDGVVTDTFDKNVEPNSLDLLARIESLL
ncbi:glutathione peroxidase [Gammaproteobacteria bacterium]|nr:glutathione peroxidase [Gammaproteobacteria bacterium]MDA9212115.1 glutathione peroxidase [Gammaproteobacteria bacterium]MDC1051326.1 glutathione peroxidase [Gammaproteobacteria bacterium]